MPSAIPGLKREIRFKKGDIKDNRKSSEWVKDSLSKVLKPGYEGARFFKVNNKRIFLNSRCFLKPIQFLEMFANTAKNKRLIKQLEKTES